MSGRAFAFCRPGPVGAELCVCRPDAPELERLATRELGERQALDLALQLLAGVSGEALSPRSPVLPGVRRGVGGALELVLLVGAETWRVPLTERRALELANDVLARLCQQLAARNAAEVGGVGHPWVAAGS